MLGRCAALLKEEMQAGQAQDFFSVSLFHLCPKSRRKESEWKWRKCINVLEKRRLIKMPDLTWLPGIKNGVEERNLVGLSEAEEALQR